MAATVVRVRAAAAIAVKTGQWIERAGLQFGAEYVEFIHDMKRVTGCVNVATGTKSPGDARTLEPRNALGNLAVTCFHDN